MKYLSIIFPLLFSTLFLAQDIITKKSGDELEVKIVKINKSNVMYKKHNDLEGATFIMDKTHIFMIKYEDGKKVVFEDKDGKNKEEETLLRKGLRIGLHATPAIMSDPDLLSGTTNTGTTISGGLDVYYYFTDNIAFKTGVIVNALPDFEHYKKPISGGYTNEVKTSYINFVGVPIKISFATGGKVGFYLETGTTFFFQQFQSESFTYNKTIILQDVVTGVHFSPTKLISIHAGPSFQFNLGRYMIGAQAGISFALPNAK